MYKSQSHVEGLIKELKEREPATRPTLTFAISEREDLQVYDLLVAYYPQTDSCVLQGYQFKSENSLNVPLSEHVTKSFVMRGRSTQKPSNPNGEAVRAGWIPVCAPDIDRILGPTFAPLLDFERPLPSQSVEPVDSEYIS